MYQGVRWVPTWKSLPYEKYRQWEASLWLKSQLSRKRWDSIKKKSSCFTSFVCEFACFGSSVSYTHSMEWHFTPGLLWPKRVRFAWDPKNNNFAEVDFNVFNYIIRPRLPTLEAFGNVTRIMGRLAQTLEGGGKRRIVAIGNYVRQRLLHPFHVWLITLLKVLPMDGTLNQVQPLEYIKGKTNYYSFDLKAATDRWPLSILFNLEFELHSTHPFLFNFSTGWEEQGLYSVIRFSTKENL